MTRHIRGVAPAVAALGCLALVAAGCGTLHEGAVADQGQGVAVQTPARTSSPADAAQGAAVAARHLPKCQSVNPGGPLEEPGPLRPPPRTPAPRTPASPEPSLGQGVVATTAPLQPAGTSSLSPSSVAAPRCVPVCPHGYRLVYGKGATVTVGCVPIVGKSTAPPQAHPTPPPSEPPAGAGTG